MRELRRRKAAADDRAVAAAFRAHAGELGLANPLGAWLRPRLDRLTIRWTGGAINRPLALAQAAHRRAKLQGARPETIEQIIAQAWSELPCIDSEPQQFELGVNCQLA
ncbi:hypothetical protein XI07_15375 [Bradyrhizobium sp. CCBAU 11445]|nr:hypothetical protein [Bradyrhizobium sp. CCBAU 11445]